MSRIAATALVLMLLPHAAASDPEVIEWDVHLQITADVHDNYAHVAIAATIHGPGGEYPFQARVPTDAFVTGFSIQREGELWHAEIKERAAASQQYNTSKQAGHTTGLIEQSRNAEVVAFNVHVGEGERVVATLHYEQYLPAHQDIHTLHLDAPAIPHGQDMGADFLVSVCHQAGIAHVETTPSRTPRAEGDCRQVQHAVGPRSGSTQFAVAYQLPPTADEGDPISVIVNGTGYLVHAFRAPPDAEALPLDLVMVLDTSGSMRQQDKLLQMQDAAMQLIDMLDGDDRLAIVPFASTTDLSMAELAAAEDTRRSEAKSVIDAFVAGGSTNIEAGLRDGFASYQDEACPLVELPTEPCGEPRSRIVVFLTDGQATVGETHPDALRSIAGEANPGDVRLFGLAFGSGADIALIRGLAQDNGGTALYVPQGAGAEVDLRRFMMALATPVLEDVHIDYDGLDVIHNTAPVLFQGSELLATATFVPTEHLTGNVSGTAHDGPRQYSIDHAVGAGGDHLARLVIAQRIQHLQAIIEADGEGAALVDEVTRLGLEWGFVTDYTSLVVSLPTPAHDMERSAEASSGSGGTMSDSASPAPASPPRAPDGDAGESRPIADERPPSPDDAHTPGLGAALLLAVLGLLALLRRK